MCSSRANPISCLDLGSSDTHSFQCITKRPTVALKSISRILRIVQ